ncbi:AAA family ATPase [Aureispira sp. CCB-QB1]|uniref:AAA family ATPase n=1 Tax=Aureispira sp. CCB-QB1 TaxID=1313421 RepID=UPI000695F4C3|nr:AAA family ATPase [Aureispira sp. CCB-QB1]
MAKIINIGLENYRVFKEYTHFDLSPITILTGPNSSGKSSLFKALLLLKNNTNVNSLWKLDFSGRDHKLGTFKTTKNDFSYKEDLLRFSISFELNVHENIENNEFYRIPRRFITNRPFTTRRGVKFIPFEQITNSKEIITLNIGYKEDGDNGKLMELVMSSSNDNTCLSIYVSDNPANPHTLFINLKEAYKSPFFSHVLYRWDINDNERLKKNDTIDIEISPYIEDINRKKFSDDFAKILESFTPHLEKILGKQELARFTLDRFLNIALSPFLSILGHFEYIEAFRANTRRIYTNDSQGTSFNELLVDFNSESITKEGEKFINKWLKTFKIADRIVFQKVEGVANAVYLEKGNKKTLLADLGFGITQFLPVLMKIGMEQPRYTKRTREKPISKLILLEEPETNLHPKFQSFVAAMITDAINRFEVNFIIETHSEYFIRKLQFLTAKGDIKDTDTALYYIHDLEEKPKKRDQVERLYIRKNGALDGEFGKGFIDEANNLIGKIWEVR